MGKDSEKFKKELFPDEKYVSLSESSLGLIDKLKKYVKGGDNYGNFSTFEKMSQYLGLSLALDDGFRSSYVMSYLADSWLEKNGSNTLKN